jgi:tRNA 2-thiouridine synthesizing protein A
MADKHLDVRDLNCPLPVLKAKKAMSDIKAGGTLEVLATDPGAPSDFEAFCRTGGYTLIEQSEADGVYRFIIRRAG